jgi:hypothetical protein
MEYILSSGPTIFPKAQETPSTRKTRAFVTLFKGSATRPIPRPNNRVRAPSACVLLTSILTI